MTHHKTLEEIADNKLELPCFSQDLEVLDGTIADLKKFDADGDLHAAWSVGDLVYLR